MGYFLLAVQFLTIMPVRVREFGPGRMAAAMVYFPVVGLLIGFVLAAVFSGLTIFGLPHLSVSIAVVVGLIVMTGGLHLDGIADTADAFLSRKNTGDMLVIMRDPRVGAMGAAAIVCVILVKVGCVYALTPSRSLYPLVIMPVVSRWALVMSMRMFPYARVEGRARLFIDGATLSRFLMATVITVICAVGIGWMKGLCYMSAAAVTAYACGAIARKKIGGITGDTLGAANEMVEIVVLCTAIGLDKFF